MQLKLKTRYALRMLLCLSKSNVYINAEELSRQANVPCAYLHRIVTELRDAGIVESNAGCKGGCRLRQAPLCITLFDILLAVDDLFDFPPSSMDDSTPGESSIETIVLLALQKEITTALSCITLDSFCQTPPFSSAVRAGRLPAAIRAAQINRGCGPSG